MITLSKKAYSKFVTYFEDSGFSAQDVPKAIVIHGLLDVLILALTWGGCYTLQPSNSFLLKGPIERLVAALPERLSQSVGSTPFFNTRLGQSYLEASCLRKLIRPVAFPVKLYLTLKVARLCPDLRLFGGNSDTGVSGGSDSSGGNSKVSSAAPSSGSIVASAGADWEGAGMEGAGAGAAGRPVIRRIALLAGRRHPQHSQQQQQQ